MARKTIAGLYERNGVWHIDKVFRGHRLQESTGTSKREEAEQYLIHRLEALRQQIVYGVRQKRIWREAATRYLIEHSDQPSIGLTAIYLEQLDPYIGDLPLSHVDDATLGKYVHDRMNQGVSNRTINIALERVIRILNLCQRKWRDAERRPWLDTVPIITKLDEKGKNSRQPYPMSWEEQSMLFAELPDHQHRMALFKVNTGAREQEVCKLRWDWEIRVPEIGASVFLVPENFGGRTERSGVKNGEERLIVLNRVAGNVIEKQRGLDPVWVFPYGVPEGSPMHRMNGHAWRKARTRAAKKWQEKYLRPAHEGFANIRVHDLKHSFGRRLRAAGVDLEDRRVLLGHTNGNVTSHYSGAEIGQLIDAANKISASDSRGPVLTILKRRLG